MADCDEVPVEPNTLRTLMTAHLTIRAVTMALTLRCGMVSPECTKGLKRENGSIKSNGLILLKINITRF